MATCTGFASPAAVIDDTLSQLISSAEALKDAAINALDENNAVSFDAYVAESTGARPDNVTNYTPVPYSGVFDAELYIPPKPLVPSLSNINFNAVASPGAYGGYVFQAPNFPPAPSIAKIEPDPEYDGSIDITVPANFVLGTLEDPQLAVLKLPSITKLNIEDFTGVAPDLSKTSAPTDTFQFNEVDYNSDVLTQADSLIQQMMSGGVGVPDIIWKQIWERATVEVDHSASKLIHEVKSEWSSKGFSLPQGVEAAQIKQVRQDVFNKRSELARDNAIQHSQEEIKNLQFAVQQGIAFETLRGGWHEQEMQRLLDASKYVFEASFKLFEADLALINAEMQLFNTEASVYKTVIEAEISKLEEDRLNLQAQELLNKVNDTELKLYASRVQGLQLNIEEYNATVNAAVVENDVVKSKVNKYKEDINAFTAKANEALASVEIHKSTIEAEGVKAGIYETSARAFASEMGAYEANMNAEGTRVDAVNKINQTRAQIFDSEVKMFGNDINARASELSARANAYGSDAGAYGHQSSDNQYVTKAKIDLANVDAMYNDANSKIAIANAQAQTGAASASATLLAQANNSISEINSQLAGSIYAAVNISSSESVSSSESCSNSTSDSTSSSASSSASSSVSEVHTYDHGTV